jgi:hypothetical protein
MLEVGSNLVQNIGYPDTFSSFSSAPPGRMPGFYFKFSHDSFLEKYFPIKLSSIVLALDAA